MSFAKSAGLTAGFLGAFGLGIAVSPYILQRGTDATPAAVTQPSAQSTVTNAAAPAAPVRAKREERPGFAAKREIVIEQPATHPELKHRLKTVLNRGADINKAGDGFRNAEEFAMVARAARNTGVPFMVLKHRVLEENMSLDEAIRASKPDIDAAAEMKRAKAEAIEDVKALES
jgi:hypothetical protein